MPTTTDKMTKKVHHALDAHAIIRTCLPDVWTVVQPAEGHIEIGRGGNLAGYVHYEPATAWR